jgi:outer membrane protein W
MKSLKYLALALIVASSTPLFAQSRSVDVTGWLSRVDPHGDNNFGTQVRSLDFDSANGYGAAVNVFWGNHLSTEFAAYVADSDVRVRPVGGGNDINGDLEIIPITATLQYHLMPEGRFDPYIGGGVAYVLFDNVDNTSDLNDVFVGDIDFKDDYGFVANAGLSIDLTSKLALNVEGKYVPVDSAATAHLPSGTEKVDISVNPLIFSAGLQFQF